MRFLNWAVVMCGLLVLPWATAAPTPIKITGSVPSQILTFCYFEPTGDSAVKVKITYFSSGITPNVTLWRLRELNQECDATTAVTNAKAEPMAFGLDSYSFIVVPNASTPKAVQMELKRPEMAQPFRTTIYLRNL